MPETVHFSGDFTAQEREFLRGQFGNCSFELLARSARSETLAVIRWRGVSAARAGRGTPGPLFAPPAEAHYVLDMVGPREPQLKRIDRTEDLELSYPGHFPRVDIRPSAWERLGRTLRRLRPRGRW